MLFAQNLLQPRASRPGVGPAGLLHSANAQVVADENSDQQASRPRQLHHISSNHQQMRFRKMQKNRIPDQYMIDEEMHSSYGEEEAEEVNE
jgi:hypothetical protein